MVPGGWAWVALFKFLWDQARLGKELFLLLWTREAPKGEARLMASSRCPLVASPLLNPGGFVVHSAGIARRSPAGGALGFLGAFIVMTPQF